MKLVHTAAEFVKSVRDSVQNPKAMSSFRDNRWESVSTEEYTTDVKYLALALLKLGVKKGDRIGLVALPSDRWSIADLAIMSIGAVSVPLFANISEENFLFEIRQTEVQFVFVGDRDHWQRYEDNQELFKTVISLEETVKSKDVITYDNAIEMGKAMNVEFPDLFEKTAAAVSPEDLATIIYTSGSTGVPKGAEHTHRSIFSLLHVDLFNWDSQKDLYLNVLPLAHVFGRMMNLILLRWSISIYYFNDLKNFGSACRELHPTILVVVPRLLEKVFAFMVAKVQEVGYMKKAIGQWAFDLAAQEENTIWKSLFHPIAEKLVYSSLRAALGGNLRVVISGGAALNPHLCHFFLDIGVPIYEGWGLTESCPVTVNRPGHVKAGTIGLPIENLVVKTSPEGELLIKGPNVMSGYFKNPQATASALDSAGWLHTGDKGEIDSEGFITIIGRLKELFKTSQGETIAPIPIEQALCRAPFVDMALVIAENRKFASCLLFPDFQILSALKTSQNQPHVSDEEFLKGVYIKDEMEKLINKVNAHLNHWEQIHAYRFVPYHLTIDAGDLTPSMKIRREVIETKFKPLIDEMYAKESQ